MKSLATQMETIRSLDGLALEALRQPAVRSMGSVLLVHGFSADLHEEGAFDRLADHFVKSGFSVSRVSFRGHGASGGTQQGMTISGERLDLSAAYGWMTAALLGPYAIVAASFGAVATLLQLHSLTPAPRALVLWNPVLELRPIFIEPTCAWGKRNFGSRAYEVASKHGYALVDEHFKAGQVLLDEMQLYPKNLAHLYLRNTPALILHGDQDTYVPIDASREAAALPQVELIEIAGSDHGFPERDKELNVVLSTVEWLSRKLR